MKNDTSRQEVHVPIKTVAQITELAIDSGMTHGEYITRGIQVYRNPSLAAKNTTDETIFCDIETRIKEFNQAFKIKMKVYIAKERDIWHLKRAYHYYLCGHIENMGEEIHDKTRTATKYKKARETIEHLLEFTGYSDNSILPTIDKLIDSALDTKQEQKNLYDKKMEVEFEEIALSPYQQSNAIHSFKIFRNFDKFPAKNNC